MSADLDSAPAAVPHVVRLHLGRAAVQTLAGRVGVRLLHIKGDTVDRSIRKNGAPGTDIDVMTHPAQIDVLDDALRARGWRVYSTFLDGSPFGHAQTYLHDTWGYLDVHRSFPGIGIPPEQAFDRLWSSRGAVDVSGVSCAIPDLNAQAVIAILNAARSRQRSELDGAWSDSGRERRMAIEREVDAFDARLAFDAAFGRLEAHHEAREFRLWKAVAGGGGRVEEWWGRIVAEPSFSARVALVLRALHVNRAHLEHRLGRPPTRREVFREFFSRPIRGLRELIHRS